MRIYKDKTLKEEVVKTLDFGEVLAGQKKEYTFYLYNEIEAPLREIKISIVNTEVKILKAPVTMGSKETSELKLEWSPSVTIKRGLKTPIEITAIEVWS